MKGEKDVTGSPESIELTDPKGAPGKKGMKGDKEERNGETVYVRWGHDQCPSTAQLVYSGRAGLTGSTGLTGAKGAPGQKGMKADTEESNGGTVYVR